eukprot:49780-Eustigmatos_ZCMA.PRE.1
MELQENQTLYAIQLNCFALPTSLPSGYTNPASMTFPATSQTPQLVVPSTNIRDVLGFSAGTYPSSTQTTDYSTYSSYCPQLSPVQSVIMSCSMCNNPLSIPPNVLYSFSPAGVEFGSLIESKTNAFCWIDMSSHVVSGSNNSKYTYAFPLGSAQFSKHEVAVASVSMYYSWKNLTSAL